MRPGHVAIVFVIAVLLVVSGALWLLGDNPAPRGSPPLPPADPESPGEGPEAQHRRLESADLVGLYPSHVLRQGAQDRRVVALTFDDGPDDRFTPQILDILRRKQVPATFFITGVRAEEHPQVLSRIVEEGHVAANHGYLHARYSTLTPEQIRTDLIMNRRLLEEAGSPYWRLFRPPYGALDVQAAETLVAEDLLIILWTVDTLDWRGRTAEEILETVTDEVREGSIILQHSAGGPGQDLSGTVEALPEIIDRLREGGFTFVTIPALLAEGSVPAGPVD